MLAPDFSPRASAPLIPFTYTGREWEPEVGMYFFRARFMDPRLGRFISQDPLGVVASGLNLQAYAGNNPVGYTDPLGLEKSAPNNAGNPNWTAQDRLAAGYAKAVYGQDGVTGGLLKQMGIPYNPKDGFAAALYQGPDGKYYLAMRGTEPLTWADWKANLTQGLNISASQYNQANSLATMVYFALGGTGNAGGAPSNFVLVGHSLGGGLASAAANNTGVNAITFNAAGLSEQYNNGYLSGDIRAHYIRGEILSTAQDYSPMYNAVGTRISHPAPHWYTDPVSRHLMSSFDGL